VASCSHLIGEAVHVRAERLAHEARERPRTSVEVF
jgi:hypothetical protein